MPMKREKNLKRIAELLAWIQAKIQLLNKLHFLDINISSETFFSEFLNLVFGYSFINLNQQSINNPYADLYDSTNNIYCQVTSDKKSDKIKESIKGIESLSNCNKDSKIVILLLTSKPRYTTDFNTKKVVFDKEKDIIDTAKLIQKIDSLENEEIQKIKDYLELNLDAINDKEKTICSEDETIIEIVHFLSNSDIISDEIESIVDPEDKINRRFSKYANYIKDEYKDLFVAYGNSLTIAYNNIISDEIRRKKHNRFLKTMSVDALDECENNPKKALDKLVVDLNALISSGGKNYDKNAIRFYLVDQTIKCNVFPNEVQNAN